MDEVTAEAIGVSEIKYTVAQTVAISEQQFELMFHNKNSTIWDTGHPC